MYEIENAMGALLVQGAAERKKIDKANQKAQNKPEMDPLEFLASIAPY